MGTRSLQTRLTVRLLVVAGLVLAIVCALSVGLTKRTLDAADTDAARAYATNTRESMKRELAEGDSFEAAAREILEGASAEGVRVAIQSHNEHAGAPLPDLAVATCETIDTLRVCAEGDAEIKIVAGVAIDVHQRVVRDLARAMALVMLVGIIVLGIGVRRALRGPIGELSALVEWTSHVTASKKPPPVSSSVEVQQLTSAFDALVERLLEAISRERTVTAHIAHELRTPLAAMIAEIDSLQGTDREALARLRGDADRLADVIEAILVLSNPSGTKADGIVNLADLARKLAPGVTVTAPDEALIEGDECLLELAVRNLIDNAKRYGGGAREVRVTRDRDNVELAVVDDGPGLDSAARSKMFDRHWRGVADGDGRGLGLALVRVVAERHGGEARARGGADGKGLEVAMTLGAAVGWHEGH